MLRLKSSCTLQITGSSWKTYVAKSNRVVYLREHLIVDKILTFCVYHRPKVTVLPARSDSDVIVLFIILSGTYNR